MQTKYKFHILKFGGCIFLLAFTLNSCSKFVEINSPVTSTNAGNVYTNDATAAAVLTGIYANLSAGNQTLSNSLTNMYFYPALSSDELTLYNLNDPNYFPYYSNNLTSLSSTFWNNIYSTIFVTNSALEGLNSSTGLTPSVKQQLIGEAGFIRALCYFYLVNLYGDVPLATTSDYKENSKLSRSPKAQVYQQIINDLIDAQNRLNVSYLKSDALTPYSAGAEERLRPTKSAATALLARVYLYINDYSNAEAQATNVINNSIFGLSTLASTFSRNSSETIWALQPVGVDIYSNTGDGALFILPPGGPNTFPNEVYLSNNVLNSFEAGDQRKTNWVDSVIVGSVSYFYPYKYKIGAINTATAEYIIVLRLAEQYLIRAEARAQLNNINGAQADLNSIRKRAGLSNTTANDKSSLLTAILHERQVELFTEWGHRWLDLKRTNIIDAVMSQVVPQKGGTWIPKMALYPIPQSEIVLDPNLVQNEGY